MMGEGRRVLPLHFGGDDGSGELFVEVVWESDAGSLEDVADLTGDVGPSGDDAPTLFDGGLLEAVEVAQQWLPFEP